MNHICRLCLKGVKSNGYISVHQTDNNGVAIATLVKTLIPEVYLGLSLNPVICTPCYDALRDAYSFRLQCLRSENLIGIYVRETHCNSVTILLKNVVDYWMNVYKTKPCQSEVAQANISEWFGLQHENEDSDQPIKKVPEQPPTTELKLKMYKGILEGLLKDLSHADQQQEKNTVVGTEQHKCNTESDKEKNVPVAQGANKNSSNESDGPVVEIEAQNTLLEEDRRTSLINKIASTLNILPKEVLTSYSINPCGCPSADDCPTSSNFKETVVLKNNGSWEQIQHRLHKRCVGVCEFRHIEHCKCNYTLPTFSCLFPEENVTVEEENRAPTPDPPLVVRPGKTYTNKTKTLGAEVLKIPESDLQLPSTQPAAIQVDPSRLVTNQECDDDIDVESLIQALQKDNQFEALGFTDEMAKNKKSYIIRKFIDTSDNSVSYALSLNKDDPGDLQGKSTETQNICDGKNGTNSEAIHTQAISLSGINNQGVVQKNTEERIGNIRFPDTAEKGLGELATNTSLQAQRKSSFVSSGLPEENDEESLGIITFQPDSTPSDQSPDKPMPLIRVRPVSSLQKVRTLNHELFPLSAKVDTPVSVLKPIIKLAPPKKFTRRPPIVLNSKMVKGIKDMLLGPTTHLEPSRSISPYEIKTVKPMKTYSKPLNISAKLVAVTSDHVKKMGINPLKVKKLKVLKPLRKIMPQPPSSLPVNVDMTGQNKEVFLGTGGTTPISRRGSEELRNEAAIEIKEEPLDYVENRLLYELQELEALESASNEPDDWDGETTRSASETSIMDRLLNDNLSELIENIPDVAEEQFDEPEYVHINNVSFADLTKLVKESKQYTKELEENQGSSQTIDLAELSKNLLTNRMKNGRRLPLIAPKSDKPSAENKTVFTPLYIPPRRPRLLGKKKGKRLRLVPVDEEGREVPKAKRRRVCVRKYLPSANSVQKNVCVLFTNFTSVGDYINDHDYLINPYMRNDMAFIKRSVESCLCLLCDWVHPASGHIEHMRCHGTRCSICQVDFHNVFILNLHVRGHTSTCPECGVNVTYARYRHHAETHNKSLMLSNIDLLPEEARGLKENDLLPPATLGAGKKCDSPSLSPRRSRRFTRSKNVDTMVALEEEEACIYDKATKSFITPSVEKQQKLLAKCCIKTKETENNEPPDKKAVPTVDSIKQSQPEFITLADLLKTSSKVDANINLSHLYENVVSNNQTTDKGSIKPKNINKCRKKRKRFLPAKRNKKFIKKEDAETINDAAALLNKGETIQNPSNIYDKTEGGLVDESRTKDNESKKNTRRKLDSESESLKLLKVGLDAAKADLKESPEAKKSPIKRKSPKSAPKSSSNALKSSTGNTKTTSRNKKAELLKNNPLILKNTQIEAKIGKKAVLNPKTPRKNNPSNKPKMLNTISKATLLRQKKKLSKSIESKGLQSQEDPKIVSSTANAKKTLKKGLKSSLKGNLKMKIKGIKLNPFVSLPENKNLKGKETESAPDVPKDVNVLEDLKAKACGKKSKTVEDSFEDLTEPVSLSKETKPANVEAQSFVSSEARKKADFKAKIVKDPAKALEPSPIKSDGTRSSRSRGSLNLVEGLKIDGPVRPRKPRKSAAAAPFTKTENTNENLTESGSQSSQMTTAENTVTANANSESIREVQALQTIEVDSSLSNAQCADTQLLCEILRPDVKIKGVQEHKESESVQ